MLFGDYNDLKALHGYIGTLSKSKDFIGVNLERKMLVLKWLYLFGYSNRKTILMLINCTDRGGYRFITELTKQGYIEKFENPFYNQDLFMLGKKGRGLLVENGLMSVEEEAPKKHRFSRTNRVVHENGLHQFILLLIQFLNVDVTTINREVKHESLMVDSVFDAVFPSGDEFEMAIEFERTTKSRRRIEYMLVEHMDNMKDKLYDYVCIGFTDQTLYDYFIKILIDKPKRWHKDKKTHRLTTSTDYNSKNFNGRFRFFLIEDDKIAQHTTLESIRKDKTHRLHTYTTPKKWQKISAKTVKEKEQERLLREELKEEIRTEVMDELREEIEDELREQQEARRPARERYLIESTRKNHTKKVLEFLLYKYERRGFFSDKEFIKYFDYLNLRDDEDFEAFLKGDLELK